MPEHKGTSNRGFASMDAEKQRAIASKGGQSVPPEKRSFSQDPRLAAEAGRKGGESVPPEGRSFSQNRELAAQAGRKGGQARGAASRKAGTREQTRKPGAMAENGAKPAEEYSDELEQAFSSPNQDVEQGGLGRNPGQPLGADGKAQPQGR